MYEIKNVRKLLIINEIMVEAAGVELITMLTARKLLILGSATRAKKTPLSNPLYVYCTKIFGPECATGETIRVSDSQVAAHDDRVSCR